MKKKITNKYKYLLSIKKIKRLIFASCRKNKINLLIIKTIKSKRRRRKNTSTNDNDVIRKTIFLNEFVQKQLTNFDLNI